MRRLALLLLAVVLACGTAAAWYEVDSLLYIPGEDNMHLLHNNGSIFSYSGIWADNSTIASGLGDVGSHSVPTVFQKDGTWYMIAGEQDGTFHGYHWDGSTWQTDATITTGLGDVGDYSAPSVFQKDGTLYLVTECATGTFHGYHWSGSTWQTDSAITSGLGNIVSFAAPTFFQKDGTWYMISGDGLGTFHGYHWDGSAWQTDATITSGLGDVGINSAPTVFQKDGTWYLVSGEYHGMFNGYYWDGSTWQADATITSGLGDVGINSAPTVFQKDGMWYLISGDYYGTFTGRSTPQIASPDIAWSTNATIASGLGDVGDRSTPSVFQKDGTWNLISGNSSGTFSGYHWDGSAWQADATITSGLGGVGAYSAPSVFQKDRTWYLISGSNYGTFSGYHWDGSAWQTDATITIGLGAAAGYSTHTVFEKDGTWYLIVGAYNTFSGYHWDGSAWQTDATIISGLSVTGTYFTPTVFQKKDGTWNLISGNSSGTFSGYHWDGSAWQTDATITSGLGDVGDYSAPTVFEKDGTWYLISGKADGTFSGRSSPQNTPTPDTHWTAASLSSEATLNLTYYDLSNQTRGVFTISSGTLDWLRVTDLTADEYYSILDANDIRIETQQASSAITFTSDLPAGEYTISQTTYPNETGVHGVVYEGTTETNAPISSVIVTIYNTTWSDVSITDSSGYYIFTGLTNDTYVLSFKKDRYITVDYQYVAPTDGEMYSKDIWMQIDTGQFYSRHYVTFCVCNIWGTRYAGVDAICYKEGIIDSTGTTGSDGSVVLSLFEDVEYHITFSNATQGISEDLTLYPRDDYYYIIVGDTSTWTDHEHALYEEIHITVAKRIINDTHAWINVTYHDNLNGTTELDAYINETNLEDPTNETLIAHHAFTGNLNDTSYNFTVPMTGGQAYFVRLHHEHTEFGSTWFSYAVRRAGMLVDLGIPSGTYIYICIILILFVGAMFGGTTATTGAVSISVLGWLFLAFGWLQPSMGIYATICVSAASVYAVSVAITHRQRKAGYA